MKTKFFRDCLIVLVLIFGAAAIAHAGSLVPSGGPAASGNTVGDIYTRLTTNAVAGTHSFLPSGSPANTLHSLSDIYSAIPTIDPTQVKSGSNYLGIGGTLLPSGGTAGVADVCAGKTFFGASQADWNLQIGSLAINPGTVSASSTYCGVAGTMVANPAYGDDNAVNVLTTAANSGTYNATNLIAANVRNGVVFGNGLSGTFSGNLAFGDDNASNVLTSAASAGNYNASLLTVGTVKNGTAFGAGLTGQYPSATYPLSGGAGLTDIVAGDLINGREAWTKSGNLVTGNMAIGNDVSGGNGVLHFLIPTGYYSGKYATAGDTNLAAGNVKSGVTIFGIAGSLKSVLPDSGQTSCSNVSDATVGCSDAGALAGEDGKYTAANSSTCDRAASGSDPSFTNNHDGTITDNCTGLMWKTCSEGQTFTDGTPPACGGSALQLSWYQQLAQCENLILCSDNTFSTTNCTGHGAPKYSDWRLPSINELLSIVNYSGVVPAINGYYFPSTPSDYYWTSTSDFTNNGDSSAWMINFGYASAGGMVKGNNFYFRCVRG